MTIDTIDGEGFEEYSPYLSKCALCAHFNLAKYCCKAFPDKIPSPFLKGYQVHDKVVPGQTGKVVLTTS